MRKPMRRTGIVRISESEESTGVREVLKSPADFNAPTDKGRFCAGCQKWDSFLKVSQKFCRACSNRLRALGYKGNE